MADSIGIAVVYPDLLGTYGDGGNAAILAQRLRWRGIPAEVVEAPAGSPVPSSCDIYVVGGGEDAPQALAADQLAVERPLHRAVDGGAAILAICAGPSPRRGRHASVRRGRRSTSSPTTPPSWA